MLIDTHTHLYLDEFNSDLEPMLQRAAEAGVSRFYLPNIDSQSIKALLALTEAYPEHCFPMMGVHPCSIKAETWKDELARAERYLDMGNFIAVGEIGLDLYWDKTTFEIQKQALQIQCGWALDSGKPVSLHSREATQECIDIIRPFAKKGLRGVFHCFSGTTEEAKEVVDMGFLLGIGGVVTFKKSNLPSVLLSVSPEAIVLETDAPYLAPVPYRGKRNEPAYLREIVKGISEIYQIPVPELEQITSNNAMNLFQHER